MFQKHDPLIIKQQAKRIRFVNHQTRSKKLFVHVWKIIRIEKAMKICNDRIECRALLSTYPFPRQRAWWYVCSYKINEINTFNQYQSSISFYLKLNYKVNPLNVYYMHNSSLNASKIVLCTNLLMDASGNGSLMEIYSN